MRGENIDRDGGSAGALSILRGLDGVVSAVDPGKPCYPADMVREGLTRMIARFDHDYAAVGNIAGIISGPAGPSYGEKIATVFQQWGEGEGRGPSMPALMAWAAGDLHLESAGSDMMRIAMMASVLAEIPNDLLYHGNLHYRKVMVHIIRLMTAYRDCRFSGFPTLESSQIVRALIAAAIHDLGHEGGDNLRDGIYTPGYMEQKACDMAQPYFEFLGMSRDDRAEIETMVFCTDITFFAGENSPCARMKKIYRHFFSGGLPEGDDAESMMIGKLRPFEGNPALAMMAMMLHEADIATSAGLTYAQSKAETISIMEERGISNAGPAILLRFLTGQLDGRMVTPAARLIFSGPMESIIRQVERDVAAGIESY